MDDGPLSCVEVIVENNCWIETLPDAIKVAKKAAAVVLRSENQSGEVVILLADDDHIRDLNSRFRGKRLPTNVLSFPSGSFPASGNHGHVGNRSLGDIIISYETTMHEAEDTTSTLEAHVTHLIVHGMLHILGYDHQNDVDTEIMTRRETEILADLGWPDPYGDSYVTGIELNDHG